MHVFRLSETSFEIKPMPMSWVDQLKIGSFAFALQNVRSRLWL
jgi:hypothetical protein